MSNVIILPGSPEFSLPKKPRKTKVFQGDLTGRILALDTTRSRTRYRSPAGTKHSLARAKVSSSGEGGQD
jgi:hypothetical protein